MFRANLLPVDYEKYEEPQSNIQVLYNCTFYDNFSKYKIGEHLENIVFFRDTAKITFNYQREGQYSIGVILTPKEERTPVITQQNKLGNDGC